MKVLIVEDELIPANYLKKVLETNGYKVLPIVAKGKNAITVARQEKPHITILEELWESQKSQQTLRSLIHRIRENTSQNLIINVIN